MLLDRELPPAEDRSVLADRRDHPRSAPLLALTSDITQLVDAGIMARRLREPRHVPSSTGRLSIGSGRIELPPWTVAWLVGA